MKKSIDAAIEYCATAQSPKESTDTPVSMKEAQRRFNLLECLDAEARSANSELSKSPADKADAEITLAFSGQNSGGTVE
jgi:hypothetical protein